MASGEPTCPRCGRQMLSGADHLDCHRDNWESRLSTCKPFPGGVLCSNLSYSQMCEEREKVLRGTRKPRAKTQALIDENNRLYAENDRLRAELARLKGEGR